MITIAHNCVRPDVDYGLSEGITSKIPKKVLNAILACVRPEVDHDLSEGIASETTRNEI